MALHFQFLYADKVGEDILCKEENKIQYSKLPHIENETK